MPDMIRQGLTLSVIGISLTFVGLGLLILTIIVLKRLFRPRQPAADARASDETVVFNTSARDTEEEVVAAIAIALAYLRSPDIRRGELGATLETEPGPWWTMGQVRRKHTRSGR